MKITHGIKSVCYYIAGKFLGAIYYDKKYLRGRWFCSKYGSIGATGWKWICNCIHAGNIMRNVNQAPWPVDARTRIVNPHNIQFDADDLNIFQSPGCYFQAHGKIVIGKGSYIAPNVGIITSNHNFVDLDEHTPPKDVYLGKCCWIGMNSMILPGVHLGDHTIVGAGSVVTKSFPKGNCVIAGNPARIIREEIVPNAGRECESNK